MANSLCLTPACLQVSATLLSQMAPNWDQLDPCTDFEKMVCHGYRDNNPPDMATLSEMSVRNDRIITNLLEGTYAEAIDYQATSTPWKSTWTSNAVDEANFKMIKQSYDACMNTTAISALNTKPLVDLIASMNSIWPLSKDLKAKLTPAGHDTLAKATYFLH
jgi:endothelin-converting enzyme